MRKEGNLHRVVVIVAPSVREIDSREPLLLVRRKPDEALGPVPSLLLEHRLRQRLEENGSRRTTYGQGSSTGVVAHHDLLVRAGARRRGNREGNAPIQQGAGAFPGHAELADQPAVRLSP